VILLDKILGFSEDRDTVGKGRRRRRRPEPEEKGRSPKPRQLLQQAYKELEEAHYWEEDWAG
jgi:hypothetical protein